MSVLAHQIEHASFITTCLPKDQIINRQFNSENNWIEVLFGIGSRKEVNNCCNFPVWTGKPKNVMQPPKDNYVFLSKFQTTCFVHI